MKRILYVFQYQRKIEEQITKRDEEKPYSFYFRITKLKKKTF